MSKITCFLFGATLTYAVVITIGGIEAVNALREKTEETPETKE